MNIPHPHNHNLENPLMNLNAVGNRDSLANKKLKTGKYNTIISTKNRRT